MFQGLIKGEIKGFFRNIIGGFNIDKVRDSFVEDKLNEMKYQLKGEVASVIKNNKKTDILINTEKNECLVQSIECLLNKNKCKQVFLDFKQMNYDDDEEYEKKRDSKVMARKKFEQTLRN